MCSAATVLSVSTAATLAARALPRRYTSSKGSDVMMMSSILSGAFLAKKDEVRMWREETAASCQGRGEVGRRGEERRERSEGRRSVVGK